MYCFADRLVTSGRATRAILTALAKLTCGRIDSLENLMLVALIDTELKWIVITL